MPRRSIVDFLGIRFEGIIGRATDGRVSRQLLVHLRYQLIRLIRYQLIRYQVSGINSSGIRYHQLRYQLIRLISTNLTEPSYQVEYPFQPGVSDLTDTGFVDKANEVSLRVSIHCPLGWGPRLPNLCNNQTVLREFPGVPEDDATFCVDYSRIVIPQVGF